MSEIDQMKLDMVTKLASLLMEEQPELTMEQALSIVLNSDTYQRLLEDNTTLYYQSLLLPSNGVADRQSWINTVPSPRR